MAKFVSSRFPFNTGARKTILVRSTRKRIFLSGFRECLGPFAAFVRYFLTNDAGGTAWRHQPKEFAWYRYKSVALAGETARRP